MLDLPDKYNNRIVETSTNLRVYGDMSRIVFLGTVQLQSEAIRLLDGYDNQESRRRYIAEKVLKGNEDNEDAKQITERLNHDLY